MRTALPALASLAALLAASPATADTFRIEIDYMVETGAGAHSHMPTAAEVQAVVQMFACQGHTLIVDVDDPLTHHDVLLLNPNDASDFFGYSGAAATFGKLKSDNFDNGAGWHYCIFGHNYQDSNYNTTTSSGLGEMSGDDFLVSLGSFANEIGTAFDRAATLAHEFGHNLGLGHCGTMNCGANPNDIDWVGQSPVNVASIMSYMYQLTGVRTNLVCQNMSFDEAALFKEIDYSHGTLCSLDESALDETFGTGMSSVDWDCSSTISGVVAQDLNGGSGGWCGASGQQTWMYDYDEWSNISSSAKYKTLAQLDDLPTVSCITVEEWRDVQSKVVCPQPALATESCISGQMFYLDPAADASADGRCSDPFNSVTNAHSNASSGSVFFLKPGTYDESSALILDRRVKLFSVGTAVIR